MRTHGGEHHKLGSVVGGQGEEQWEVGRLGRDNMGEMPNVGEGEKESKAQCHVCTYATVLHALLMYPKT